MNIKLEYSITADEFLEMIKSVGWKIYSNEQVKKALKNTMYMVKITENDKIIGMGVKKGEKMQIELTPTAGNEEFYKKAGFKYKPDVITGMYLWVKK